MLILGIDTSTSAISVAIGDGDSVVARHRLDAMGHSEHLAPLIAELLRAKGVRPADLTGIVVGNGPGPFTGLRVGIVTGLTMGLALEVPVFGLCSLDALAEAALAQGLVPEGSDLLVATDARRKEVYWARYRHAEGAADAPGSVHGELVRVEGPAVAKAADLPESVRALPVVGRGAQLYAEWLPHAVGDLLDVDASFLVAAATRGLESGRSMPVEPLYLRRPDALTTAQRTAAVDGGTSS